MFSNLCVNHLANAHTKQARSWFRHQIKFVRRQMKKLSIGAKIRRRGPRATVFATLLDKPSTLPEGPSSFPRQARFIPIPGIAIFPTPGSQSESEPSLKDKILMDIDSEIDNLSKMMSQMPVGTQPGEYTKRTAFGPVSDTICPLITGPQLIRPARLLISVAKGKPQVPAPKQRKGLKRCSSEIDVQLKEEKRKRGPKSESDLADCNEAMVAEFHRRPWKKAARPNNTSLPSTRFRIKRHAFVG